jgi:CRP-like cAMP-binding protein
MREQTTADDDIDGLPHLIAPGRPLGSGLWEVPGHAVFGMEWVVQCADPTELEPIRSLCGLLRTKGGEHVTVAIAVSGSAAYVGRVNPYPADIDFNEIVLVTGPDLQSATAIFAEKLQENIDSILGVPDMKFSELKIGADLQTGRGYKWDLTEVRSGVKDLSQVKAGGRASLSLAEAALQRQIVKLDLVANVDGIWKEVTKVYRLAYRPAFTVETAAIDLCAPENLAETIYQELYFTEEEARLAVLVSNAGESGGFSNPEVMKKYRDLMDVEIAHYGALGNTGNVSHLKLLKRWFNKVRMSRDLYSIHQLSRIFRSGVNSVHEVAEMMRIILLAIQKELLTTSQLCGQLDLVHGLLQERGSQLPLDGLSDYERRLDDAKHKAGQGQSAACADLLASLLREVDACVEERAKQLLVDHILRPYAEGLGIEMRAEQIADRDSLFKELDQGNRMLYLVSHYLRLDVRVVRRTFKEGETIIRFGDEARSCFVLLEGHAVIRNPRGRPGLAHIRDVGPLTLVGEIGLIHRGGLRTAEAVAATGVVAMEIPRDVFLELMNDRSFQLFISFLSTDRLMEDRVRDERRF